MKTHLVLGGLVAVFALHSSEAGQPNYRTQTQNRNRQPQAESEESGGVRGFFRGVYGEIKEGGKVIAGGYREVRDGIKSKVRSDNDEPETRGRSRYGYQSPPQPPLRPSGVTRVPRDPAPAPRPSMASSPSRQDAGETRVSAQSPGPRTLPRQPVPSPEAAPLAQARREPVPAPAPPSVKPVSPPGAEVPARTAPEIVAPMRPDAPQAPIKDLAPAPKTDEAPTAPTEEAKPIARDEKGRPLPDKPDFPTATATKDSGVVLSPYPPYDLLDVKGMASGSLAKDPATGQVFRIP